MKENVFSKQLRDSINRVLSKSDEVHPITGKLIKKGRHPHIYLIQDAYRTGKKPYDFYFIYGDYFYAIECKVVKNKSINFDIVKPHQIQFLYEVEKAGKCAKTFIVIKLDAVKNFALVTPVFGWVNMIKHYNNKSVKIEKLVEDNLDYYMFMERKKINGQLDWDVKSAIINFERD